MITATQVMAQITVWRRLTWAPMILVGCAARLHLHHRNTAGRTRREIADAYLNLMRCFLDARDGTLPVQYDQETLVAQAGGGAIPASRKICLGRIKDDHSRI